MRSCLSSARKRGTPASGGCDAEEGVAELTLELLLQEAGRGTLNVNSNPDTKQVRIVMRRHETKQLVLNAALWEGMPVLTLPLTSAVNYADCVWFAVYLCRREGFADIVLCA